MELPQKDSWQRSPRMAMKTQTQKEQQQDSPRLGGARSLDRSRSGSRYREDYFSCSPNSRSKDDSGLGQKNTTEDKTPDSSKGESLLTLRGMATKHTASVSTQRHDIQTKSAREQVAKMLDSNPALLRGTSPATISQKEPKEPKEPMVPPKSPAKKMRKAIRGKEKKAKKVTCTPELVISEPTKKKTYTPCTCTCNCGPCLQVTCAHSNLLPTVTSSFLPPIRCTCTCMCSSCPSSSPPSSSSSSSTASSSASSSSSSSSSSPSSSSSASLEPPPEQISGPSPSSSSPNVSQQAIDTVEALKIASAPIVFEKGCVGNKGESPAVAEQVLLELINTEKSYVLDLILLMTSYKMPTSSNSLLPPSTADLVFVNVHQLLLLHTKVLNKITNKPSLETVVEAFGGGVGWGDFIREYGEYANGYSRSVLLLLDPKKLTKEFLQFCNRSRKNPVNKSLSLEDFLIKPIQRICKYPLLFRELSKHLGESHPLFEKCSECQKRVAEVAGCVNAARHAFEATKDIRHIIDELQELEMGGGADRVYLGRGAAKMEDEDCIIFLFSDIILVCLLQQGTQSLMLKKLIDLSSETLIIEITEEGEYEKNSMILRDVGINFKFVLNLPTREDVVAWNSLLIQLKKKYHWDGTYEKPASVKSDYDF